MDVLTRYFLDDDVEKRKEFFEEWEGFKFDVLSLRRKWLITE